MAAPADSPVRASLDPSALLADRLVALPDSPNGNARDLEYVLVDDGGWQQIRLRSDPRLFEWPGVYEHLVRRLLRGRSPATIIRLLERELISSGTRPQDLRALDLGAGNGWVGEELLDLGAGEIFGVDRHLEAAQAADREHPDVYDRYMVLDMRRLSEAQRDELMSIDLNCLVCIDPLAADEPPANAFTEAFNVLAPGGWIAFHLHEQSETGERESRFAMLVQQMIQTGAIALGAKERYQHRLTTHGEPVFHTAFIGRKQRDFDPAEN